MEETGEQRPSTPVRAKDKRADELAELRQKQLAKVAHGQLDGLGQPMTAEAWENLQKRNSEQTKKQQQYAALNLHSHHYHADDSQTNDVKEKLKQQELEAAQMLHSYRGKPEAILSHQVKRIPKTPGSANKTPPGDFVSSSDEGGVPELDINKLSFNFNGGEASTDHKESLAAKSTPVATSEVDNFLQSLDDFISSPDESSIRDTEDDKDQHLIAPQQSNSSDGSTEWVVLAEEEKVIRDDEHWTDMNNEPVLSGMQESGVQNVSPVLTEEVPFVEVTELTEIPQSKESKTLSPKHDVEVPHLKDKDYQEMLSVEEEKDNIAKMWTNLNNEQVFTETHDVEVEKVSPVIGQPFIEMHEVTDTSQSRESETFYSKHNAGIPDIQRQIAQGPSVSEWEEKDVSFSFGLLTDGNSSPSHGRYSASTGIPLLDNIVSTLQSSALNAIKNEIDSGDLLGGEKPLQISVTEDCK